MFAPHPTAPAPPRLRRGRPPGRTARGATAREAILAAATRRFAASGYYGSSLARIAADRGLSQAGLLHHFGNKRELLEEVLAERDERDRQAVGAPAEAAGLAVLDFARRLVAHNARQPTVVRAFAVLSGEAVGLDHPARDYLAARYATYAAEIFAVMDGLQTQWLLDPGIFDMPAHFGGYVRRLRAALAV